MAGVVAAAVVLGTIALVLVTTLTPSAQRLIDGTRVVLEKTSYGKAYGPPKPLLDRLFSHLPAKWSGKIKWHPCSGPSGSSSIDIFTFWLRFSSPTASTQGISYAIADENGFEAGMIFTGFYGSYKPAGFGSKCTGLARGAALFPRRSKNLLLRLYQQDSSGHRVRVAEFPVKNSGLNNYPTWNPQPLPITQLTNGLALTLVRAEVGTKPPGPVLAPYDLQAGAWSEFRFRVSERDQPASGWTIKEMLISDATGNRVRVSEEDDGAFNGQFSRTDGDEIVCLHRWDFWTDEGAWKLHIHFERPVKPGCWVDYSVRPEFLTLAAGN